MADWDGLRRDLESAVSPPPLAALRQRRRQRQQRRTIALTCAVAMVGTASGMALLGRGGERDGSGPPLAARPSSRSTIVSGDRQPPLGDHENHVVTDVDFVSATTGWAIGVRCEDTTCDIATFRTDDGGRTWGVPLDVALRVPRASFHEEDATGGAVRSLKMVDERRGYAFNPDLYVTDDGGETWQRVPQPSKVTSVSVVGESVWVTERGCPRDVDCDVVLRAGTVGGDLRELDVPETDAALAIVRRGSATDGYLLTWDGPEEPRAAFHATADGGTTWTPRPHPCPDAGAAALSAWQGRSLWAVCTTPAGRQAFQSADGGTTWRLAGLPPGDGEVTDLVATSAQEAYLTLQDPGRLLVTRDGGRTWRPATGIGRAYGYANLDVVSETRAWAMGDEGQLWRTTDGERWERLALPPRAPAAPAKPAAAAPPDAAVEFTGLHFPDRRTGWALGRRCADGRCRLALRRTTDGGESWRVATAPAPAFPDQARSTGNVRSVVFADDRTGYLYGAGGVYVTRDAGAHWKWLPGNVAEVVVRHGYVWMLEHDVCGTADCRPHVGRARLGSDELRYGLTGADSPIRTTGTLAVADGETAYLVEAGWDGETQPIVLATGDGGLTWTDRDAPCRDAVRRVAGVVDGDLWVLCGDEPVGAAQRHRTARSADGGASWDVAVADGQGHLDHFAPLSPAVAWRADSGAAPAIRVTTDGGRTWRIPAATYPASGGRAAAFQLLDATYGFALLTDGVVLRMTDGRTWRSVSRP